nr:hypothetical protein [Salaquimonas pukyongi]
MEESGVAMSEDAAEVQENGGRRGRARGAAGQPEGRHDQGFT